MPVIQVAMAPAPAGPPSEPSPLTRLLLGVVGVTVRLESLQVTGAIVIRHDGTW